LIEANGLSMAYRSGKGVFGLSFAIKDGEAFGYLGPNGSGKTTTIRLLMGFMRPDSGQARIGGLDCWKDAAAIKSGLGFLPGENSLFEDMNGHSFLKFMLEMRGIRGMVRAKELSERFALDPAQKIRRMSKGTKQKLAIVAAFMHDPKAYILDEPTSGLDPLMQNVFIELVLEEKKRGKTFLMSSHNFEEIDRTCDRAAILKEGRLAAIEHISELKAERRSSYIVLFQDAREIAKLKAAGIDVATQKDNQAEVIVGKDFNAFFKALAGCDVKGLYPGTKSLEDTFLKYYGGEVK
jgi:ABC-2 type transport system ATP-binding protein